jgi:hypothetical protein
MSVLIRVPVAVFVLVALAQPARAQTAPPVADILVGYSVLPANGDDFPRGTSHGVQLAATAHLTRWFGLVADLAVHSSTRRDLGPGFEGLVAKTTVRESSSARGSQRDWTVRTSSFTDSLACRRAMRP